VIEDRCGHGSLTLSAKRGDLGRTPYFRSRILSKSTISGLRGHGQLEQCHRQWYSNSQVQQQVALGWRPRRKQVASKSIHHPIIHINSCQRPDTNQIDLFVEEGEFLCQMKPTGRAQSYPHMAFLADW